MSKVIIRNADYDHVRPVVREIFDAFPLELINKKVFIKPNLVRHEPPEKAVTTHPLLLRAIAEEVKRRGGKPYIGDNGTDVRNLYRITGVEKECAPFMVNISKAARLLEIGGFQVPISRFILDAEVYISVPKLKTHGIAGMTCCLKNSFGLLPGYAKPRVHAQSGHAKRFTEFLVELYRWKTPDLCIVDGILAMEGNGPSFGDPRRVGKIIAGRDGIAVDTVCSRLIGYEKPRGIKSIDLAEKKGLVRFDIDHPELDGPWDVMGNFVHPDTYTVNTPGRKSSFAANQEHIFQVWSELGHVMPALQEGLCTKCGDCAPACPSGALVLQPYPELDSGKCTSCFSCVEACPEQALRISISDELRKKRNEMGM